MRYHDFSRAQSGAILIFCLVFLLVLTLLATTGMRSALMQERMAGNLIRHQSAVHAADAVLREAQQWLTAQTDRPSASADGTTGIWLRDSLDPDESNSLPWWEELECLSEDWWLARGTEAEVLPSAAAAPRYVIEELSHIMDSQLSAYRITVRAPGLSNSIVVLQQSTAVQTFATK